MNWKKIWRNLARFWMGSVLLFDTLGSAYMIIHPDSVLYDLADSMNWAITPTWIATVFPTVLAMLWLSCDVILYNRPMGAVHFGFMIIVSLLWAADLFFYETFALNQYHWTKIVDGFRWLSFAFAAWYYKFKSSPWSGT